VGVLQEVRARLLREAVHRPESRGPWLEGEIERRPVTYDVHA